MTTKCSRLARTFVFLNFWMIIFLLGGCNSVKSVPNNYALNANSGKGLLLTSVTYQGSYSGYSMKFNRDGSKDLQSIEIGTGTAMLPPGMLDWDIEKRGVRGNTFAVELPPGDYEFSTWSVSSGSIHVSPSESFTIKFKISPGEAIYIGNFNFVRKSGFGDAVTSVDVSRNDESERDLQILKTKYASFDSIRLNVAVGKNASEHWIGGNSSASFSPAPIIFVK